GRGDGDDLSACSPVADRLLWLSDREGFCAPPQEAMSCGIPVVAYDAGAVAETLHGGGVLLKEKRPEVVAEIVARILRDPALRAAVLATEERAIGQVRGTDFGPLLLYRLAPAPPPLS